MPSQFKGVRRLQDLATGEILEIDYIEKRLSPSLKGGWRRVYLADFLQILDEIGNAKIKVLEFVLDNIDSNNKLTISMSEVSKKTKISYKTIHTTFKALEDKKLLKKVGTAWVVMPDIVSAFGSDKKNARLLIDYSEDERGLFDE